MGRTAFADASAIEAAGPGRWSANVPDGWDITGNANGGYLLALAGRALARAAGHPDPITVTAHYLTPVPVGPVQIETTVERSGSRFSTVRGGVHSEAGSHMSVLGSFGDLARNDGPQLVIGAPPVLPAPDECVAIHSDPPFPPPFVDRVDVRLHPDDVKFVHGEASGTPTMRGWFRLADDEPLDPFVLLCATDAFPPTIFNARLPIGWTPTLELTAHVRGRPATGWLACVFATRFVTGGFLEADGELWDGDGRLVAQSRQLALVPRGHPDA